MWPGIYTSLVRVSFTLKELWIWSDFFRQHKIWGLYAIVRPSPFICAEWEFGGLPAWLLTKNMRLRSSDSAYIEAVGRYYDQLLSRLVPHLLDNGGNILMMQVENEYGSYGEDKAYLRAIRQLMEERGVTLSPLYIRWSMASYSESWNLD